MWSCDCRYMTNPATKCHSRAWVDCMPTSSMILRVQFSSTTYYDIIRVKKFEQMKHVPFMRPQMVADLIINNCVLIYHKYSMKCIVTMTTPKVDRYFRETLLLWIYVALCYIFCEGISVTITSKTYFQVALCLRIQCLKNLSGNVNSTVVINIWLGSWCPALVTVCLYKDIL